MESNHFKDLPIRSKLEMMKNIGKIIHYLHEGDRSSADPLVEDLKSRAVFFDDQIQQDVLSFSEQIDFQYDYDSSHLVTDNIQKAADKLIEDLGFSPPSQ
jgi:hypothetical protein